MVEHKSYACDICGKVIEKGHQELYMITISLNGYEYKYDEGSNSWPETYHVHNDMTNKCFSKISKLLCNPNIDKDKNLEDKTK